MAFTSPAVAQLLSTAPAQLPLIQTAPPGICKLDLHDAPALFPGARSPDAGLAGLLLRLGYWAESHTVAQDIQSVEGSYWHGILHRVEPDSSNARYWFRRVGDHSIGPDLLRRAAEILNAGAPKHWRLPPTWDHFVFIDWCDQARQSGGEAETAAIKIQMAEWQLLFKWCTG